jgi:Right handed beta helix region
MFKLISPLSIAGLLASLTFLDSAPALAASPVTFVSGKGSNTGSCASPSTPCRTFQFALDQTSPGGEIKALDPANYGGLTITKSISITGVEGAGIFRTVANAVAISIKAGPSDTINLSHLTLDGLSTATFGIQLTSGGSLTVADCAIRDFIGVGVQVASTATTTFLIADTVVSGNNVGIAVGSQVTSTDQGTLDRVSVTQNSHGIFIGAHASVLALDSTVADNAATGFDIFQGGVLRLVHSAVTGNLQGVIVGSDSTGVSAGNNVIRGNGTDVTGTLSNVGTQ